MKRAIVLLSGGLDSATCLLIAKRETEKVFALSFDYGQRHRLELERALLSPTPTAPRRTAS